MDDNKEKTVEDKENSSKVSAPPAAKPTVPFKTLFRFMGPFEGFLLFVSILCAIASGVCLPLFTLIFGDLLNALNDSRNLETAVNELCARLAGLATGMGVAQYLMVALSSYGAARQVARLRSAYFTSLLRQDAGWVDTGRASEASTRLAGDTVALEGAVGQQLCMVIQSQTTFIAGVIIAFVQGWKMALVVLAFIPVFGVLGGVAHKYLGADASQVSAEYAKAGAIATESLTSLRTVASFGGEHAELARYDKALSEAERAGRASAVWKGLAMGSLMFTMFAVYAVGMYWGGRLVIFSREEDPTCVFDLGKASCFTGGDVLNVLFALLMGGGALGQAGPAGVIIAQAQGAAGGIFAVLDRVPPIDSGSDAGLKPAPGSVKGRIEFRNVTFSYPSRPDEIILKNFNLIIEPGTSVALVGASGSGKSTIVALIQRQYDPLSGQVLLDGVDLKEYNVQALRAVQSIVAQEPQLFATTVHQNIALGLAGVPGAPAATADAVLAAARSANADDFIRSLPQGYDTQITGAQLSGGQKQRVAIARAIIRQPQILLLDEATSALDTTSERLIQRDLDRLIAESKQQGGKGRTAVMIAHRLSTVVKADKIIVLNRGEIVECGSHADLMAKDGSTYRKLRELQRVQDEEVDVDIDDKLAKAEQEHARARAASSAAAAAAALVVTVDSGVKSSSSAESAVGTAGKNAGKDAGEVAEEEKKAREKAELEAALKLKPVPYSRLVALIPDCIPYMLLGLLASLVMGTVFPVMSILLSRFMSSFYEPDNGTLLDKVTWLMIYFFIIAAGAFLGAFFQQYSFSVVCEALQHRVRKALFTALLRQPIGWHDLPENSPGRLTSRLASDTALLSGSIGTNLALHIQNTMQLFVGLGIAFWASWRMTLVIVAIAPALGFGGYLQMKLLTGYEEQAKKQLAPCAEIATEAMSASRTVAAFGLQGTIGSRFSEALEKPTRAAKSGALVTGMGAAFSNFTMIGTYALAFYVGAVFIKQGHMNFQELMQAFFAVVFAAMGMGQASSLGVDAVRADAAKRSIFAIIDLQSSIDPLAGQKGSVQNGTALVVRTVDSAAAAGAEAVKGEAAPAWQRGDIVFQDVHFKYPARPDQPVLRGLSLSIPCGRTVAIVGPSGSGKSTIIQLLQRFYDPEKGSVSIGGQSIAGLPVQELRTAFGWVQQEAPLFADSLAYNVYFGVSSRTKLPAEAGVAPDAGADAATPATFELPEPVVEAAKSANAHEFILGFKNGYATFAGERGSQLSGGQKQRVAIARAIIRQPHILLLDEATSALDSESEAVVQASIDKLLEEGGGGHRTTLIIAHRLSTIRRADEIIVVDKGVVVERGTHDQLMVAPGESAPPGAVLAPLGPVGVYRRMVLEQDAGLGASSTAHAHLVRA